MSIRRAVDVLVVGLGPAGSSAAAIAARAGLSVLGIDRKKQVGVPVQCAEFIPQPLAKLTQHGDVLMQRIAGMHTMLSSGNEAHSPLPGLMVDRSAFDQALAREAERRGTEVRLAMRLLGIDALRNVARLQTAEQEFEVGYRALIAADGPHSVVAHAIGLPPLETVHTRQYTVPLLKAFADTDIWLSEKYPGGYAWLFPKGAFANLGIGVDRQRATDMKALLDELHDRLVEQGRVGREIIYRTGGAIPVAGLREKLVVGNVLLVGDAAGFTHPITGAGIAAAVASGERAGHAVASWLQEAKEDALAEFEEDMRDQFESSLRRAVAQRRRLVTEGDRGLAGSDTVQRSGWIAFPEYFSEMV